MHKRMALNAVALLGLLASTNVLAEIEPGFYAGVGVGKASVEIDDLFDGDDTAFKVFGGYNINQYFALEAAYFDAGEPDQTIALPGPDLTLKVATTGLNLSLLGRAPLGDMFSLFGKVGYASYDVEISSSVNGQTAFSEDGSDDDLSYGVGAAFNLGTSFELRAEYEVIDIEDVDFTVVSVNGVYRF
jgi:OOP family OmpA-OmpF porin